SNGRPGPANAARVPSTAPPASRPAARLYMTRSRRPHYDVHLSVNRRVVPGAPLLALLGGLVAACTGGAVGPTIPSGTAGGVYRDPAGWSIQVEPGWRVVPFRFSAHGVTAAGAQI